MAKKQSEIKRFPTHIYTFKQPDKPGPSPYRFSSPMCLCGRPAEWEVYEFLQPHCTPCKDEAISSIPRPFVRELGGFDDAS